MQPTAAAAHTPDVQRLHHQLRRAAMRVEVAEGDSLLWQLQQWRSNLSRHCQVKHGPGLGTRGCSRARTDSQALQLLRHGT
jgi:hypothetical protein